MNIEKTLNNNRKAEIFKKVSVVIVCMNNLKNLLPCLESIIKSSNKTSYEIIVVAYLFSQENLDFLRLVHPAIQIIESNEIRGFAENNNLAFKVAKGEYCFVLNDDTLMKTPVIDFLFESFVLEPMASFMSPKILNYDGTIQSCGRPPVSLWSYFLTALILRKEQKIKSKHTHKSGIFQSFNVVGAAFMVKTSVFKELGFFDEKYFFCPEDIALSTLANKRGYKCFVNSDIEIYHLEGGTSSMVQTATFPVIQKGIILFLGDTFVKKITITLIVVLRLIIILTNAFFGKSSKNRTITLLKSKNALKAVFLNKTTKELFVKYYNELNLKPREVS